MKKVLSLRHRKKIHARPKLISKNKPTSIWLSAPSPPWIDLPTDVTANILHRLGPVEILQTAQKVCATWWRVCKDPSMWRVIHMIDAEDDKAREISRFYAKINRRLGDRINSSASGDNKDQLHATNMCCRAVDRSQGGLVDISIGSFCTGDLLRYISDRSSRGRLKRLTVAAVVPGKCLTAAVKKLGAGLEELRLFFTQSVAFEDMETIGICCPMLNTFAFNNSEHRFMAQIVDDGRALAIGKSMPNLRHLELCSNSFTEKGLQAVLDGCPCLESLDLRRSHVVGLEDEGELRRRCSWIKDVKLPSDSTWLDDYEEEEEEYDRQEGDRYRRVHVPRYGKGRMNRRTGTLIFKE